MKDTNFKIHDPFFQARNLLNGLIDVLCTQKWLQAEHGEVEQLIHKDGYEVMRLVLQGHLDQRTRQEPDFDSVQHGSREHTHKRKNCSRQLNTIFGKVRAHRKSYSDGGANSIFPQDAQLNLSRDQYSDGLRRQTAFAVSEQSFDKASESISRNTGTSVAKRQVENITRHLSQDFDAFYELRQGEDSNTSDLLTLTCDGKGVVMRQEDLRPATQKAAKSSKHKKQTRLSRGEKRNGKRMATVASVYDIAPHIRSADSIIGSKEENSQPPKPVNKRVWASVEKSPREVIEQMFSEARRRDPKQKRQWAVLVDGQPVQLKTLRQVIKKQNIKATIVLDFIHVLEYLWKAAYCFFDESSQEAEDWVKERALKILAGKASQVAAGIRRSSTKRNLNSKERKNADKCSDYLLKYKNYLHYDNYLAAGYPIATGVIEGACRYLIKDRMDITGARWGLQGAEAVIKLRAIIASNDFEEYFSFHKRQERQKNYPFYERIAYKMAA
ncbi:ISKra4 family transposase [candidate division KSB1 bacterium]|nr:ISKra4 family transposase [candidate division KSB1 bacterium]NIR73281.1 ISKra4 family transposase [candidate division KSB1 bacterium]NIS26987.1 ISKra4 family transposase [candidate division KSB1 bacterium]NIT73827.1 ISKra4 family transposase [candidate division KSB1 bacterium]NIU27732.1 ISKra4 family transposase [candidate division KSB1 bacterium]